MDFTTLLSIAHKNEKHNKSKEIGGYKTELSSAKREKHEKPRSQVVQKLIDEKKREKEIAERKDKGRKHDHGKHSDKIHDHKNSGEKHKKFTIPKKKEKFDDLLKDLDSDKEDSDSVKEKKDKHGMNHEDANHSKTEHKHTDHKSSKYKTDYSEHKGDKHKNESRRSHGSKSSSHVSSETKSSKHNATSSQTDRKSSSNKDRKSGSSSDKYRSSSKNKDKQSGSSSSNGKKEVKKKPQDLSLDELREQVKRMKQEEAVLSKEENKSEMESALNELQKNRIGIQSDEAEARKVKILSRTQMILERTKARLAEEKNNQKQPRQKGRRSNDKERSSGKDGDKIKSRSVIKDDYDSGDDDDPNASLDLSFNQDLMKNESGDILKNIKKKIDEKLSDYNFPDKPVTPKKERQSASGGRKVNSKHSVNNLDRHRKKVKDREKDKRERVKEMMRKDYKSSFSNNSGDQSKPKKPVIVRRFQQQPPPMNFNDLLKIAAEKTKEKVPDVMISIKPQKKVEERLFTQEEIDRRNRAEEVKRKRAAEEAALKKGAASNSSERKTATNLQKPKSDSSLLKGALTGKFAISSQPMVSSKQKNSHDKSKNGNKYDVENENVLVCKPSSSNVKKLPPKDTQPSTNPWDRIYGQIQQRNPKPEKRKRPVFESSDEEDDEYDQDDDFIDDDDCQEDYSAHIRSIFGYDKRKYKYEDENDADDMEANFSTIMKEEARSAKIGKMEDLEDIRREEEELRMKRLAKKKMKR